jgi:hypothetical protein
VDKFETRVRINSRSIIPVANHHAIVQMEEMIAEKVEAKEAELHATYDERLRNSEER